MRRACGGLRASTRRWMWVTKLSQKERAMPSCCKGMRSACSGLQCIQVPCLHAAKESAGHTGYGRALGVQGQSLLLPTAS
eukprot:1148993-Pelagomonas_calceolata.AAC.1